MPRVCLSCNPQSMHRVRMWRRSAPLPPSAEVTHVLTRGIKPKRRYLYCLGITNKEQKIGFKNKQKLKVAVEEQWRAYVSHSSRYFI